MAIYLAEGNTELNIVLTSEVAPPPNIGSIDGFVRGVSLVHGEGLIPLEGVHINLDGFGDYSDADGYYRMEGIPLGTVTHIWANKKGYVPYGPVRVYITEDTPDISKNIILMPELW